MKKKLLIIFSLVFLSLSSCGHHRVPPTSESESQSEVISESLSTDESESKTSESSEEIISYSEPESEPSEPESIEESLSEESESDSEQESESVEESESIHESEEESISEEESESFSEQESDSEEESEWHSEEESESESEPESESHEEQYQGLEGDPINTDTVAQDYYKNISKTATGATLANQLKTLVNKNRCSTGYSSLWNYYPYCDANPDNPESNEIIAFYRGTPSTQAAMNKEHVWPNSRGGNLVEGDPHMTRPTLTSDNSSRGNSFYVEGKCSTIDGWDPKMDGLNEKFRGDSARIIFYAAIAKYGDLKLVDKENDETTNKTMGKLSDLIKWNFEYPISKYEKLRNEVLSGETEVKGVSYDFNRNPFIDDRTLPCRIWGNTNSNIQALCQMYMQKKAPTHIYLNESNITLELGGTTELSVASVAPAGAYNVVKWSSEDENIATIDSYGKVKAIDKGVTNIVATSVLDKNVKATCQITVNAQDVAISEFNVTSKLSLKVGSTGKIGVSYGPSNAYPRPTFSYSCDNESIATVDQEGNVTAVEIGTAEVTVTARQNDVLKTGTCQINVVEDTSFYKVTSEPTDWSGRYLIVNEKAAKVFNSASSSIDSSANAISVTIGDGEINVTDELLAASVTIVKDGDKYIMKTSTGLTIYSSERNIKTQAGGTTESTFKMSGSNAIIYSGDPKWTFQYNSVGSMFRYYSTSQQAIQIYRLL